MVIFICEIYLHIESFLVPPAKALPYASLLTKMAVKVWVTEETSISNTIYTSMRTSFFRNSIDSKVKRAFL
jgi:hypothetical protein